VPLRRLTFAAQTTGRQILARVRIEVLA